MARILLAEDEFLIRLILVEELIDHGYEVVEAESGDERRRRALVSVDVSMLENGALDALLRQHIVPLLQASTAVWEDHLIDSLALVHLPNNKTKKMYSFLRRMTSSL